MIVIKDRTILLIFNSKRNESNYQSHADNGYAL